MDFSDYSETKATIPLQQQIYLGHRKCTLPCSKAGEGFNVKGQQGDIKSRAETKGLLLLGYKLGLDYPKWVTWVKGCDADVPVIPSDPRNILEDASQQCILKPEFLKVPSQYCVSLTFSPGVWYESVELGHNDRPEVWHDIVLLL